jgi:hypothetical protein
MANERVTGDMEVVVHAEGERADDLEAMEYGGEAPTVEVRVYRDGTMIHRELCESTEAAADVVELWSEAEGVECVVDDLSVEHAAGQILEPGDESSPDETYPRPSGDAS